MDENASKHDSSETAVPQAVVSRLSLYLREVQQLVQRGCENTSSTALGQRLGFSNSQVRKDLAYFGQFGYPGIGYKCQELITEIKKILGTDRAWPVALIGFGNLGHALLGYRGFNQQGFRIVAVFDNDPAKINTEIEGVPIYGLTELSEIIHAKGIRLAILAVPATAAQDLTEKLVAAGIEGILNFAPVTLSVSPQLPIIGVDLAIQLEQLTFSVMQRATEMPQLPRKNDPSETEPLA
jgi:redox-sensing transcriptional repressor